MMLFSLCGIIGMYSTQSNCLLKNIYPNFYNKQLNDMQIFVNEEFNLLTSDSRTSFISLLHYLEQNLQFFSSESVDYQLYFVLLTTYKLCECNICAYNYYIAYIYCTVSYVYLYCPLTIASLGIYSLQARTTKTINCKPICQNDYSFINLVFVQSTNCLN